MAAKVGADADGSSLCIMTGSGYATIVSGFNYVFASCDASKSFAKMVDDNLVGRPTELRAESKARAPAPTSSRRATKLALEQRQVKAALPLLLLCLNCAVHRGAMAHDGQVSARSGVGHECGFQRQMEKSCNADTCKSREREKKWIAVAAVVPERTIGRTKLVNPEEHGRASWSSVEHNNQLAIYSSRTKCRRFIGAQQLAIGCLLKSYRIILAREREIMPVVFDSILNFLPSFLLRVFDRDCISSLLLVSIMLACSLSLGF